ncbi:hypothetical protein GGH94_004238 [Coemansia aciculifera]|uniref:Uncharacterized protein n=1 Tax=Coemansia aciculifera TaxID=417176 RepID=A0A9W8IIH3_9FUNG|nr:hypothetical protein GGH94_004238 [Coemansia aciculifera]KAJ2872242.1 hypothetical protein GGH93_004179 [Coemansia aciculifera]
MESIEYTRLLENIRRLIDEGAEPGAPILIEMETDLRAIGLLLVQQAGIVADPTVSTVAAHSPTGFNNASEVPLSRRLQLDLQRGEHVGETDDAYISSDKLFEDLYADITAARLSKKFGPSSFMEMSNLPTVYEEIFGYFSLPYNVKPAESNTKLANMEGFRLFTLQQSGINLTFLQRQGSEFQQMRQNLNHLLGQNAAAPAPKICYILVTLACMKYGQITGSLLDGLFKELTGQDFGVRKIATEKGVQQLSSKALWEMAKTWLLKLCMFLYNRDDIRSSLDMAAECYKEYRARCPDGGDINTAETYDKINSQLVLGIRPDDLRRLCIRLPFMMTDKLRSEIIERLKLSLDILLDRAE